MGTYPRRIFGGADVIPALIHIAHILGVVLGIGGMIFMTYAVAPAQAALVTEAELFRERLHARARVMTLTAIALILMAGILKLTPIAWGLGGIGPLGGGRQYTAILHSKIILGLLSLFFAFRASQPGTDHAKRLRLIKAALHMGIVVIVLAVFHRLRALGA